MRATKVVLAIVLVVATSLPILARKKKDEAAANTATPAAASTSAGSDSAAAANSGDVVARVAGQPITNADLEPIIGARLSQMRMQAEQNEFQLKQQAIDQIVRDKLVEAEAKAKGVTSEQLLKTEVEDKAAAPTEDEIKQVYERNKARLGNRTLEESKPEIERQLKMQKANERRNEYIKSKGLLFIGTGAWDLAKHRWMHALFSALNAGFFAYALLRLLGLRESVSDLVAGLRGEVPSTGDSVPVHPATLTAERAGREAAMMDIDLARRDLSVVGDVD